MSAEDIWESFFLLKKVKKLENRLCVLWVLRSFGCGRLCARCSWRNSESHLEGFLQGFSSPASSTPQEGVAQKWAKIFLRILSKVWYHDLRGLVCHYIKPSKRSSKHTITILLRWRQCAPAAGSTKMVWMWRTHEAQQLELQELHD